MEAQAARPRHRHLEEDAFDVANNGLLRQVSELPLTRRVPPVSATYAGSSRWDDDDDDGSRVLMAPGRPVKAAAYSSVPARGRAVDQARIDRQAGADRGTLHSIYTAEAVASTWDRANAAQGEAVAAAGRKARSAAREEADREIAAALSEQDVRHRLEAAEERRQLWEVAVRDREKAVEAALQEQARELRRARAEIADMRRARPSELEEAGRDIHARAACELEREHRAATNLAVQVAWDAAGREKAAAVAAAERRVEESCAAEEMKRFDEMKASMRRTIKAAAESHSEQSSRDRDELEALRAEVTSLRVATCKAREDARAEASAQQAREVARAVASVEKVARAQQERAVARAVTAALTAALAKESRDVLEATAAHRHTALGRKVEVECRRCSSSDAQAQRDTAPCPRCMYLREVHRRAREPDPVDPG